MRVLLLEASVPKLVCKCRCVLFCNKEHVISKKGIWNSENGDESWLCYWQWHNSLNSQPRNNFCNFPRILCFVLSWDNLDFVPNKHVLLIHQLNSDCCSILQIMLYVHMILPTILLRAKLRFVPCDKKITSDVVCSFGWKLCLYNTLIGFDCLYFA